MENNFVYNIFGDSIITYAIIVVIPLVFVLIYALIAILGELENCIMDSGQIRSYENRLERSFAASCRSC